MNNLNGKSAILYRRVSTTGQKLFGNSLNAQQGSLREFCTKNSMTISKEFQDKVVPFYDSGRTDSFKANDGVELSFHKITRGNKKLIFILF